ncbi:MAG: ABC transporter permease [Lachnospiraceae bacterium]|jgi:ABC-type antimicrobial peptide transport system permease subunit|nr:ABC transporter permease [Lachnospiraceae bacterium]
MTLTAKLAYSQIKVKRSRTVWTLLGIVLTTAMITAICGFLATGDAMLLDFMSEGLTYTERTQFMKMLVGLAAVLGSIIAAISIVVISNAFRVSAGERTAQFGILKSVGATKRQIAATVMYECLWLSAIAIPAGILLGMAVHLVAIELANYFLISVNRLNATNDQLHLRFAFRWWALVAAAVFAFLTVLLSAWLPARKSAKIPAIEAIRGIGEVDIKAKQLRTNRFIQRFFGFEGALAAKSFKRSRRHFRATVVSLATSIVLVLAAHSLGTFGLNVTSAFYADADVNVVAEVTFIGHPGEAPQMDDSLGEQISARFRAYPDTTIRNADTDSGPLYYQWAIEAGDAEGFAAYANEVLAEVFLDSGQFSLFVMNISEMTAALKGIRNLVLTFVYGFVAMLILVALTNVISTISTNVRSRSREFAMLRSVGMTDEGIRKMLNLESALGTAQALLIGLPLGLGASYLMYLATIQTTDFPYVFPWGAVLQCGLGVFLVTWVTMRYAAARLRGGSIVAAIRGEG